jgi:hypothetical protein
VEVFLIFISGEQLAEHLVNHVAGVGVFQPYFPDRDLAVKDADAPDAQTAEALEVALQPLDIAFSFGQGA